MFKISPATLSIIKKVYLGLTPFIINGIYILEFNITTDSLYRHKSHE